MKKQLLLMILFVSISYFIGAMFSEKSRQKWGVGKKDNKGEFKLSAHYVWNYLKNQHQGTSFYLLRTKQLKDWTINYFLARYNQHYSRMVQL